MQVVDSRLTNVWDLAGGRLSGGGLCKFPLEDLARPDGHFPYCGYARDRVTIRHMTHTSPDERIEDFCLQIQNERDGYLLLQLIDQLNGVLDVKEALLDQWES